MIFLLVIYIISELQLKLTKHFISIMCWSPEVSAATTVIVYTSVALLLLRNRLNDRWNAIFLTVFGTMQLVDYLLWQESDLHTCTLRNQVLTRLGGLIIILEPAASLCGMLYTHHRQPMLFELAFYSSLPLLTFTLYTSGKVCGSTAAACTPVLCTSLSPSGYLAYFVGHGASWVGGGTEIPLILRFLYLLGMTYPYSFMTPSWLSQTHMAILLITWLVGAASDAHASVWCLANVAQAFVMIFFSPLPNRSVESYHATSASNIPRTIYTNY